MNAAATMSTCNKPDEGARPLAELLSTASIPTPLGLGEVMVTDLACDSRKVKPGTLFAALRGEQVDGHDFIEQAVAAGAVAILAQRTPPRKPAVPVILTDNSRKALAMLAREFYGLGRAFKQGLRVVGVTGTNGKTTTCYLLQSIVRAAGQRCGRLGSIEHDLVNRSLGAGLTTPDSLELSRHLAEIHGSGSGWVVMEASSHGLDQERVAGLDFGAGVFTNLSGDHLDYHGDIESYLVAKARLFSGLESTAWAILNADDRASERVATQTRAQRMTYGLSQMADVRTRIEQITAKGSSMTLTSPAGEIGVRLRLAGRHNVFNALAAAATATALGFDLETIAAGLGAVARVPGRLERVRVPGAGVTVLVDYAHTDDALANVLSALRPLTSDRLICVFGCGGDRDRTKRPRMAQAAETHADAIFVTSDNPRGEDPMGIIDEIVAGFGNAGRENIRIEPDRAAAIEVAIRSAQPGDVVLIAGKGHEQYQIVGARRLPFDDVQVARTCLEEVANRKADEATRRSDP